MTPTEKHIQVSYNLSPPPEVDEAGIGAPSKAQQSFLIPLPSSSDSPSATSAYYASASKVLRNVQISLNSSLTIWKDAIGDGERSKEDLGKVGYGMGRASRMAAGDREVVEMKTDEAADEDEDEDDEEEEGNIEEV